MLPPLLESHPHHQSPVGIADRVVTQTWEPNRDMLDLKEDKVGSTHVSNYAYAVNEI